MKEEEEGEKKRREDHCYTYYIYIILSNSNTNNNNNKIHICCNLKEIERERKKTVLRAQHALSIIYACNLIIFATITTKTKTLIGDEHKKKQFFF